MKKILGILAIAGTLVACKEKKSTELTLSAADSAKIYEAQKVQQKAQAAPVTTTVYKDESSNTAKKQGMSSAAKGAIIGGAAGAVTGAVINKRNRASGAVVGGVAGAGVGYTIGRAKDRKTGRVQTRTRN